MRRATILALAFAALVVMTGDLRAAPSRETFEIQTAHARWVWTSFAVGGSQRTITVADVNRYNDEVWLDLSVRVAHCSGAGDCSLLRRGTAFTFGTPEVLDADARGVSYVAMASIAWTDADGAALGETSEPVSIVWEPAGRLDRDSWRAQIGECDVARTRVLDGPAIATGTLDGDPLGNSLEGSISLEHTTHTYRDC